VSILLVWHKHLPVWAATLAYVVLAAATWESGSRTALLALGTGTVGVVVAVLQRRKWWQPRMAHIVLLIGAAVVVLAMFIAPRGGNSPSPLQRVFDRLPRPESEDLSRFGREMWARFGYGTAAGAIIEDHPITGVGIGAFHIVVNDYLHRERQGALPPDNAQNWWRHQIAELGALGALPSIVLSIAVLALIWRGGPYVEPFGSTTVLRMVLTGVGLASLLGVPAQHPSTWLAFVTVLFWLLALYRRGRQEAEPTARGWWVTAIVLAGATALGQAWSARADLRMPERAMWTGAPVWYGFAPPEGVSDYGELRWMARHAVRVMEVKNEWVQLAIWPPGGTPETERPFLHVAMNHRDVLDAYIPPNGPVVYYMRVPEDSTWMMLELDVSGAPDDDRTLAVALDWVDTPPAAAVPERIIR
jgi:O-antigen ligase/polysaccharide polymerase Wzy-like membrane protein